MGMTEEARPPELSRDGRELVKKYQQARTNYERAKSDLSRAESDQENAKAAFIEWIVPQDAKVGEKFSIWGLDQYGKECMFEVEVTRLSPAYGNLRLRYRE